MGRIRSRLYRNKKIAEQMEKEKKRKKKKRKKKLKEKAEE